MPRLAILIPTLVAPKENPALKMREELLKRLLAMLGPQLDAYDGQVVAIVNPDSGDKKIGCKRNELLDQAASIGAEYVSFVDDDDLVSAEYVKLVIAAIESKPDVVGIRGWMVINDLADAKRPFHHSIRNQEWTERDGLYLRYPNHLNPVRLELAQQVRFRPELSFHEDRIYADGLRPLLKTEVMIEEPIYLYLYRQLKHRTETAGRRTPRLIRRPQ